MHGVRIMYECKKCGACCRHLSLSNLYRDLDRGDGVCKYLNENLCSIYEVRPLLCRIDDSYVAYFNNFMSKEDYYRLNNEICNKLKKL